MRPADGGGGTGIDTRIEGDPGSVNQAADWLRGTLAPAFDGGVEAINSARRTAQADWGGQAGPAFATQMTSAARKTETTLGRCTSAATNLQTFASSLRAAQNHMREIRETAAGKGLSVQGTTILNPGPGPARPPDKSGVPMPPAELAAYEADVKAYNHHQDLLRAYNTAAQEAADVRTEYDRACHALDDEYKGMDGTDWILNGTDIAGNAATGLASAYHAKILRQTADTYGLEARRAFERIRGTDYSRTGHTAFFRDLEIAEDMKARANEAGALADDAARTGKFATLGKNLSRGLVAVGIGVDIYNGEPIPQAVASNVGGYAAGAGAGALASMGTSMAMGAAFGSVVPGVGTAVGAVVGLGVGIFASGAIDSLFENGPDVGEAFSEGAEAVTDTVGAIGDAASSVGDAIGSIF